MHNLFISKLQGYNPLGRDALEALKAATAHPRAVSAKRDLIREGDRPGPVIVMIEGWACRYKILPTGTRQILAFLIPGDSCDLHMGLLAEMDHGIQTITAAKVATIARDDMTAIMEAHPSIAKAMYITQLVDQGTMRSWIASMGRRTSIERLAHLICELYLRARSVGLTDGGLTLPLSQILLADALGMTPVHLNRMVRELRELGAVTLPRGSVMITSPTILARIAGFDENYLHREPRVVAA